MISRRPRREWLIAIALLGSASGAAAQPAAPAGSAAGAALYRDHCAVCHGDKGGGATWTQHSLNPLPRDFTAPAAGGDLTRERMIGSVMEGRPGTAMMPYRTRLSAAQIAAVVDYIRGAFMSARDAAAGPDAAVPRDRPAAAPMDQPFPDGLAGDFERGRSAYGENCAACHGTHGDGQGPRAYFIAPPPRDFTAPEARRGLNRAALYQAIAHGKQGTVMPAWSAALGGQEIADIAEYVFQAFIVTGAGGVEGGPKKKALSP